MPRSTQFLALVAALAALPSAALSQGFQVNEHGTCVMGRAGVGTPKPCDDGSAIFYNPAGIAGTKGLTVSAGVTGIYAYGSFTDDYTGGKSDLHNAIVPVPHFYATYGITPQLSAGFGFFVPYGLGTKWVNDANPPETFEGRFNGYDNDLRSMYFQPTVAYKLGKLISIGAGFDFVLASVRLQQRVDFSEQLAPPPAPAGTTLGQFGIPFHTDFADAKLTASGATGIGGHFGVLVTPIKGVSWGARYLTRVKLDYEGDVDFTQVSTGITLPAGNPFQVPAGTPLDLVITGLGLFEPGATLGDQTATTSLPMPDQFSFGVAVSPSDALSFMAEWQWVNWSRFSVLTLEFENAGTKTIEENYHDTNGFRMGFEWVTTPKVTLRGGYLYHDAAAPAEAVTPLLPEGARNEFTGGLGIRLSDRLTADVAYQYIAQDKRRGRVREPAPGDPPTVSLNSGLYTFNAHLVAATFTMHF